MFKKVHLVTCFIAVASLGCSSSSSTDTANTTVMVDETEYAMTLTPSSAPAGDVTFTTKNKGQRTHEFVVFKTDLGPDKLPVKSDGSVDESGVGVTHLDPEVEDLGVGQTNSATLHLTPGKYVVVCNVDDHYSQGMRAAFTVE